MKLHTIVLLAIARARLRKLIQLIELAPEHKKHSIQSEIDAQRKIIQSIARGE